MILLSEAKKIVKLHEELRLKVYDDASGSPLTLGDRVKGHPTIAWGRALDVRGVSGQEAEQMLANDLENIQTGLEKYHFSFWVDLSDLRKSVLVDMAYNMGIGGLMKFEHMLNALRNRDYDEAAAQIENSRFFRQTGIRGKHDYCLMKFDRWFSEAQTRQYFEQRGEPVKKK
jgi:lysozyme